MKCPKCGFELEEEAYECPRCGIVFAKWLELQDKKAEGLIEEPKWYQKRISPTAMVIRAIGGLISLVLAAFLLWTGILASSIASFIIMTFYLVFGLYILISTKSRIRIFKFAVEGIGLLLITGVVFSLFSIPVRPSEKAYNETGMPQVPQQVVKYIKAADQYCNNIEQFLSTKDIKTKASVKRLLQAISPVRVEGAFKAIPEDLRDRVSYSHGMIHNIEPLISNLQSKVPQFLPQGPAVWMPKVLSASVRKHMENIKIQLNREKIDLMSSYKWSVKNENRSK